MKLLKNSLIFCIIIVSFIGTIGVSVFQHSCSEDGVFTAYFINTNTHCEVTETVEELPTCCQKEQKKAFSSKQAIKEDCCNDEVSYFKVSLDYYSTFEIKINALTALFKHSDFSLKNTTALSDLYTYSNYEDPPPKLKSGKELLIAHQIFRI